jgi:hypothetical protein
MSLTPHTLHYHKLTDVLTSEATRREVYDMLEPVYGNYNGTVVFVPVTTVVDVITTLREAPYTEWVDMAAATLALHTLNALPSTHHIMLE